MANRSAHHSLDGYQYQFDRSLLAILASASEVTLEGLEDIDTAGQLIQCKYHATQTYVRSKIKKPVLAFLVHFAAGGGQKPQYILHAHFSDLATAPTIDFPELLAILGDHRPTGLTDTQLKQFLTSHFIFTAGDDIDTQQAAAQKALCAALPCSAQDCALYYYNNALVEVLRLSRQPTAAERTTSRQHLLTTINQKHILFTQWLADLNGQSQYVRFVRDGLRTQDALTPSKSKIIELSEQLMGAPVAQIAAFCRDAADKFFKVGRDKYTAKPVTIMLDAPMNIVTQVKTALLNDPTIHFNDGYESLAFSPSVFNTAPVINRRAMRTGIASDVISRSSYVLKVVSREILAANAALIDTPDTLITTGPLRQLPSFSDVCPRIFHLTDVTSLDVLRSIIQ